MINLIKQPKPQVLIDNGTSWTQTLMCYINSGQKVPKSVLSHYRHPEIKNHLKVETAEKCIYCESYVTDQYPGDVEHLIPKTVYPRLTFVWENLSFSCYHCNNGKRDYFDKSLRLLNPYKEKINKHIQFFGPIVLHINDSKRGEISWKMISLNRKELVERRTEALKMLQTLIDKYKRETVSALKTVLLQEIYDESSSDREFSSCKTQFLISQGFK